MDDESGEILHQQRVHDSALVKMEARVHGMGVQPQEVAEDVTLTFANAVARISSLEVCCSSEPIVFKPRASLGVPALGDCKESLEASNHTAS